MCGCVPNVKSFSNTIQHELEVAVYAAIRLQLHPIVSGVDSKLGHHNVSACVVMQVIRWRYG